MFHVVDPEAGVAAFVGLLIPVIASCEADAAANGGIHVAFADAAHFGKEAGAVLFAIETVLTIRAPCDSIEGAFLGEIEDVGRGTRGCVQRALRGIADDEGAFDFVFSVDYHGRFEGCDHEVRAFVGRFDYCFGTCGEVTGFIDRLDGVAVAETGAYP